MFTGHDQTDHRGPDRSRGIEEGKAAIVQRDPADPFADPFDQCGDPIYKDEHLNDQRGDPLFCCCEAVPLVRPFCLSLSGQRVLRLTLVFLVKAVPVVRPFLIYINEERRRDHRRTIHNQT